MFLRAVATILTLCSASLPALAAPSIAQYNLLEVEFTGPADPTAIISGTFVHVESGKRLVMPAFWDGGTTWRCRFAPTATGQWTYDVADKKGDIICVEGDNPGFIPTEGRHFRYSNGKYIHIMGNTHYDLMACSEDIIEKYIEWDRGVFNKIRFAAVTQRYHGETKAFEKGDDEDGYDFERPRPEYWQKLDRTVAKMQRAGIVTDLILAGPDITYQQLKNDFYKRYVVGRYAAYTNVWWCMGNEIHAKGLYRPAEVTRAANLIAALDPYHHPRSVHEQRKWMYGDADWPTHVIFQMKNPRVADHRRLTLSVRELGIPVVNDEPAYQGEIVNGGSIRAFWGCIMGCGYASSGQKQASKKGPYFPDKNLPPDAFSNPKSDKGWYVRKQAQILQGFMARTEWWKMNDVADLGENCFVRSEPGRQWLVLVAP
ncbi:hypothetical protein AMJ85_07560, partial [candidate division BRC1 bacterium SM23_51]